MTPMKFELFDERGALQKTRRSNRSRSRRPSDGDAKYVEDYPQNRTLHLETRAIKFNQGLSAALFTEEHLMAVINGSSRRLLEGK